MRGSIRNQILTRRQRGDLRKVRSQVIWTLGVDSFIFLLLFLSPSPKKEIQNPTVYCLEVSVLRIMTFNYVLFYPVLR